MMNPSSAMANDPQRAEKIKAVVALRSWLNTYRNLTWNSMEHTAFQRVEAAMAQFEAAMQGGK